MELDPIDVNIIRALQEDARLSFHQIARRVGVSVPTVSARVANLERIGVLAGYHAAVDPERLRHVRVVFILRCRRGIEDAVGTAVAALEEVRWTVRTEGSRIIGEAVIAKPERRARFLARVRGIRGVTTVEHHVARKGFKDAPQALVSQGATTVLQCFECGQVIDGKPVRWRTDGRTHYLCCPSCEKLYKDRYRSLRAGAGLDRRGRPLPRGPDRRLPEHPRGRV